MDNQIDIGSFFNTAIKDLFKTDASQVNCQNGQIDIQSETNHLTIAGYYSDSVSSFNASFSEAEIDLISTLVPYIIKNLKFSNFTVPSFLDDKVLVVSGSVYLYKNGTITNFQDGNFCCQISLGLNINTFDIKKYLPLKDPIDLQLLLSIGFLEGNWETAIVAIIPFNEDNSSFIKVSLNESNQTLSGSIDYIGSLKISDIFLKFDLDDVKSFIPEMVNDLTIDSFDGTFDSSNIEFSIKVSESVFQADLKYSKQSDTENFGLNLSWDVPQSIKTALINIIPNGWGSASFIEDLPDISFDAFSLQKIDKDWLIALNGCLEMKGQQIGFNLNLTKDESGTAFSMSLLFIPNLSLNDVLSDLLSLIPNSNFNLDEIDLPLDIKIIDVSIQKSSNDLEIIVNGIAVLERSENSIFCGLTFEKSAGQTNITIQFGELTLTKQGDTYSGSIDSINLKKLASLLRFDFLSVPNIDLKVSAFLSKTGTGTASNKLIALQLEPANGKTWSLENNILNFVSGGNVSLNSLSVFYSNAIWNTPLPDSLTNFDSSCFPTLPLPKGLVLVMNASTGEKHTLILSPSGKPQIADPPAGNPSNPNIENNPIQTAQANTAQEATPVIIPSNQTDNAAHWVDVKKKFGPLFLDRFGVELNKSKTETLLKLLSDGSVTLGPLNLDLIDFSIGFPISKWDPSQISVSLSGMSVNYNKAPLTVSGSFLHLNNEYHGMLAVGLKAYNLMVEGSYADMGDYKSFFVYGFLGLPPIGPPFLALSGLALGFGYNRTLDLPTPTDIDTHPLVSPVVNPGVVDFNTMESDIAPKKGSFWGAVGLRIESFKMFETFVLLILKMGAELEIDVLGRSSLILPKNPGGDNSPALAKLLIGVVARIIPDKAVVDIRGSILNGSYIYNPTVILSGGFAVLVIGKNQDKDSEWAGGKSGDFILTFGGYSPFYTPKPYYPQNIARMAMTWKPYDKLDVTADMYFAIVPEAFMFGGHITANFNSGGSFDIFVHFDAGLDFIVWWQPKHYIGYAYADLHIGATINIDLLFISIHQTVEIDINGDLSFWGPPFAGHASLTVHVLVSFSVSVDFGDSYKTPLPISWNDFELTLLPDASQLLNNSITKGIINKVESKEKGGIDTILVNAKDLQIEVSTAFPLKSIGSNKDKINQQFGIAPMAKMSDEILESNLEIKLTKSTDSNFTMEGYFVQDILEKNFPASTWNPAKVSNTIPAPPSQNENLINLCGGITLTLITKKLGTHTPTNDKTMDTLVIPNTVWEIDFSY